jgi:hypothetical protein
MVSTTLGDVSERASVFWLNLSPVPLTIFRGAMIVVNSTLCYLSQKMQKLIILLSLFFCESTNRVQTSISFSP